MCQSHPIRNVTCLGRSWLCIMLFANNVAILFKFEYSEWTEENGQQCVLARLGTGWQPGWLVSAGTAAGGTWDLNARKALCLLPQSTVPQARSRHRTLWDGWNLLPPVSQGKRKSEGNSFLALNHVLWLTGRALQILFLYLYISFHSQVNSPSFSDKPK